MAGEDPGVSSIAVLLEAIQRAWAAATGSVKAVVSGIMDLIKTGMFISWRRKMMQGQMGPDLAHGQQSLKDLRLHEQVGARIVSVEIGDFKAMDALCEELKRMELDFAITEHDHQYTLHYKESNEQDVLYAQQMALEKLYGSQNKEQQETLDDPSDREERSQDERQNDDQNRQDEQSRDDQGGQEEQSQDDQSRQGEQEAQEQQDRESHDRQERNQQDEPTPVPQETRESREQAGRETPARSEAAERTAPQPQQGPGAAKSASVGAKPEFEPLSEVMKRAKERAAAKNLARKQGLDQDMKLDRSMNKVRARELEHSR